ncbi:TPA: hypothetical protein DD448_01390 [Candidatus Collierbacteria bacterium]|nr:hypothetical protein [Candidatus Collierbacteria bacterium]HBO10588.1 hypothetical protein [Candidatus Collierbacteria bacterium]
MQNTGIAGGLWPGVPVLIVFLVWLGVVVLAVKTRELWERIGLGLIIVGGFANLWQRICWGAVRDNWHLGELLYNNGWDYLIFFGLLIYGYTYFVRGREYRRNRQTERGGEQQSRDSED